MWTETCTSAETSLNQIACYSKLYGWKGEKNEAKTVVKFFLIR